MPPSSLALEVERTVEEDVANISHGSNVVRNGAAMLCLLLVVWVTRLSQSRIGYTITAGLLIFLVLWRSNSSIHSAKLKSMKLNQELVSLSQKIQLLVRERNELVSRMAREIGEDNQSQSTEDTSIFSQSSSTASKPRKKLRHKIKRWLLLNRKSTKKEQTKEPSTEDTILEEEESSETTSDDGKPQLLTSQVLEMNFHASAITPLENMLQPCSQEGIEALKARVADIVNPVMVNKYGGSVRCFERFLVARQGNVDKAEKMFRDCHKFRVDRGLDADDEQTKVRLEAFDKLRDRWIGEYFKETSFDGSPVQLFRFGEINPKSLVKEVDEDELCLLYLSWMDMSLSLQNQSNSSTFQESISGDYQWKGMIEIYDLKGIGMHSLHMPGIMMLNRVLKLGQGNYPENLRVCYIINAPWFFGGTWSIISKVLDPNTVKKINVCRGIPRDKLEAILPESIVSAIDAPDNN